MKHTYYIKYRQPGQIFWRKLKGVIGDDIKDNFRVFHLESDYIVYISIGAEVIFPPERQKVILDKMSKEAGLQVQRA
jgi:hypothetical protein